MKTFCTLVLSTFFNGLLIAQNVGIGTDNPTFPLTVISNQNKGIVQKNADVEVGFWTSGSAAYVQTWSNHPLHFSTNNSSAHLSIATSGNIGIGTTSPAARLDINGNIRIRGGNPVAGHVLTATDALGNAEWKAPAGGAVQKVLNISFADFFPQNSFIGYSSIAAIGRYPATAATGAVTFEAPLNLPVGTKLISIQWLFFDLSAKDFSFCVAYDDNYTNDATNSKVFVGGCASSSGMSNLPQVLNKSLQNHIMLNTPYSLQVTVTDWPNTHLIHLKGARIIYE